MLSMTCQRAADVPAAGAESLLWAASPPQLRVCGHAICAGAAALADPAAAPAEHEGDVSPTLSMWQQGWSRGEAACSDTDGSGDEGDREGGRARQAGA